MEIIGILLFLFVLIFAGISGKAFADEKNVKGWISIIVAIFFGIILTVIIIIVPEPPKEYPADKYELKMKMKMTTIDGVTDTTYVITRKKERSTMKIIDNKKDYYDYLTGKYGIDEKIVFDRRRSETYNMFVKRVGQSALDNLDVYGGKLILKLGDYNYIFIKNKETDFKWEFPDKYIYGSWFNRYTKDNPYLTTAEESEKEWKDLKDEILALHYYIDYKNHKGHYTYDFYVKNPILTTFGVVPSFISADEIYNKIYDYISHKCEKQIIDNRTDIEHLESAGFDKKMSFRNIK